MPKLLVLQTPKQLSNGGLDKLQEKVSEMVSSTSKLSCLISFALGNSDVEPKDEDIARQKILSLQITIVADALDISRTLQPYIKKVSSNRFKQTNMEETKYKVECIWNEFTCCLERFQQDAKRLLFMHVAFSDENYPGTLLKWRGIKSGIHTPSTTYCRDIINTRKSRVNRLAKSTNGKNITETIEDAILKISEILIALKNLSVSFPWTEENFTSILMPSVTEGRIERNRRYMANFSAKSIILVGFLATLLLTAVAFIVVWQLGYM